ncbi:uncharacterized protein LOC124664827 [Lolium rigidum]|uniref:uncharacterized protein LOC124664827 n=1 Tax=Lolium rigidum TaxID=89674 RepID=UPI001F5C929E|nr:uncharacterized protein LOC124664827 [Lolium rigidum]
MPAPSTEKLTVTLRCCLRKKNVFVESRCLLSFSLTAGAFSHPHEPWRSPACSDTRGVVDREHDGGAGGVEVDALEVPVLAHEAAGGATRSTSAPPSGSMREPADGGRHGAAAGDGAGGGEAEAAREGRGRVVEMECHGCLLGVRRCAAPVAAVFTPARVVLATRTRCQRRRRDPRRARRPYAARSLSSEEGTAVFCGLNLSRSSPASSANYVRWWAALRFRSWSKSASQGFGCIFQSFASFPSMRCICFREVYKEISQEIIEHLKYHRKWHEQLTILFQGRAQVGSCRLTPHLVLVGLMCAAATTASTRTSIRYMFGDVHLRMRCWLKNSLTMLLWRYI